MPHHAPYLTGEARCRGGMGPWDKPEGDNGSGRLRWCDGRKRSVNAVDREGRGHLLHATTFTSAWRFLPAESLMQPSGSRSRSEEHTSTPVTNAHLVCRLLLEKKKQLKRKDYTPTTIQLTNIVRC